jgi:hypothetical protein
MVVESSVANEKGESNSAKPGLIEFKISEPGSACLDELHKFERTETCLSYNTSKITRSHHETMLIFLNSLKECSFQGRKFVPKCPNHRMIFLPMNQTNKNI